MLAALRAKRLIWNNSQCRRLPKLSALFVIAQHIATPDMPCGVSLDEDVRAQSPQVSDVIR
jgi:hypothetical protein